MLDEHLIETLEQNVRQTRNAQHRLEARLLEAEAEVELLRLEIKALDASATQTEQTIDSILVAMRSGNRQAHNRTSISLDETYKFRQNARNQTPEQVAKLDLPSDSYRRSGTVAYMPQNRGIPSITNGIRPVSSRFSDRTITQSCTLLLREAGGPLHVNELYNLLVSGGMKFKGNNPTISIAVSLNRNSRFQKVDPGTFDLVMREANRAAS
jgi:hypothetical protein